LKHIRYSEKPVEAVCIYATENCDRFKKTKHTTAKEQPEFVYVQKKALYLKDSPAQSTGSLQQISRNQPWYRFNFILLE